MGFGRRAWRGRQRRKNRLAHVRYTYVAGRRESERGILIPCYALVRIFVFVCGACLLPHGVRVAGVGPVCASRSQCLSLSGPLCASLYSFIYIISNRWRQSTFESGLHARH